MKNIRTVRGQLLMRLGRKEEGQAELALAKKLFAAGMAEEQEKMKQRLVPNPELAEQPDLRRGFSGIKHRLSQGATGQSR